MHRTGPKISVAQLARMLQQEGARREEAAMLGAGRQRHREQRRAEPRGGAFQRCARVLVDHRTDVGCRIERIADQPASRPRRAACAARGRRCHPAGKAAAAPSSAGRPNRTRWSSTSVTTCSAQRRTVHDHRVDATGLRDERNDRPGPRGEGPRDRLRGVRAAGEGDAGDTRIAHQHLADRCVSGQQGESCPRHAGFQQQRNRACGNQRRLLRRLCGHRVAGSERGGDLAGEYRERKIPWCNRSEYATTTERPGVAFPGRAGSSRGAAKSCRARGGIPTAVVGGLAGTRPHRRPRSCRLPAPAATGTRGAPLRSNPPHVPALRLGVHHQTHPSRASTAPARPVRRRSRPERHRRWRPPRHGDPRGCEFRREPWM